MHQLVLDSISKTFEGRQVILADINFAVAKGEFLVVLGSSGSGKTTLLRIIAGLERADKGNILISGRNVTQLEPRYRDVAMVFQSYALYPHMTVFENIAFALKVRRLSSAEINEKVVAAARMLGLEKYLDKKPAQLSGGQRQRVALGRAIVRNPALFLFDEPLSNLDPELRARMRLELLAIHRQLNATSLYVTHDQVEAMTLADKVIILQNGEQIGPASPRQLYDNPPDAYTARFLGNPPMNMIKGGIDRGGKKVRFNNGAELDLPECAFGLSSVYFGFRPEHCGISNQGLFEVRVEGCEDTGREFIIELCDIEGNRMFCYSRTKPIVGERCWIKIKEGLFFDGDSGQAVKGGRLTIDDCNKNS